MVLDRHMLSLVTASEEEWKEVDYPPKLSDHELKQIQSKRSSRSRMNYL